MVRRPHKPAAQAPAAAMPPECPAVPVMATLVFSRVHTHAGQQYQPGDRITVDEDTANLLHHFGVVVEG